MDEECKELGIDSSKEQANNQLVKHSSVPLEFKVNRYTTYKTVATGTINVALLTSNAKLLKNAVAKGPINNQFYYPTLSLLSISIVLQLVLKCMCIVVGTSKVNLETKEKSKNVEKINGINKAITIIAMVITFINIIIGIIDM
jgi:hypothetical protein